jgi:hypothetical protein
MIIVTDPTGAQHAIDPASVAQIYFNSFLTPPGRCTIVFSGTHANVRETVDEILQKLMNSIRILSFNIPPGGPGMTGGFPVYVNVSAIAGVAPVPGGAALRIAGLPAPEIVVESYQDVLAAIAAAKSPPPPLM